MVHQEALQQSAVSDVILRVVDVSPFSLINICAVELASSDHSVVKKIV